MTATDELLQICPRTGIVRTDLGCLHCVYSVKLGGLWTCVFKEDTDDNHRPTHGGARDYRLSAGRADVSGDVRG